MEKEKSAITKTAITIALVLSLILANILVIKPINMFNLSFLANTTAIFTFPITYVLSDVCSECYGYKWSRLTANFAFLGSLYTALMFKLMIAIPGNDAWGSQYELITILGWNFKITVWSLIAFWAGDLANDIVFKILKQKNKKYFPIRAIFSSICGKYVDGLIFTCFGLSNLPLDTKIAMIVNCPMVQIGIELVFLPVTIFLVKKIEQIEKIYKKSVDE